MDGIFFDRRGVGIKPVAQKIIKSYYEIFETSESKSLGLPVQISPSTTMRGVSHPQAGVFKNCVENLKESPTRYSKLLNFLNEEATEVVETCYMLSRLYRKGPSNYFSCKCPVLKLFPTSYKDIEGYPRLIPKGMGERVWPVY